MMNLTQFCICMVESSGRLRATRYEPVFRRQYLADLEGTISEAEIVWRATSHGLFQIMGEVLVELGESYQDREAWISDWERQLETAGRLWARNAKQLKRLLGGETPEPWRLCEAWNKGAGGAKRLTGPTEYFRKLEAVKHGHN